MKKRHFTKLEIILVCFVLVIAGLFIYLKTSNLNLVNLPNKILNTEKFPTTDAEWADYMGSAIDNYCERKEAYQLRPEFQRSLSLIFQRLSEATGKSDTNLLRGVKSNFKCLDISYASSSEEMAGADGYFLFSKDFSNRNKLTIIVDPAYKAQDDLMTAMLLSHELNHAEQFIMEDVYNTAVARCYENSSRDICDNAKKAYSYLSISCYDKEIMAFNNQFYFFLQLKDAEKASLLSKYLTGNSSSYNLPVLYLMDNYTKLLTTCGNSVDGSSCANNWFKVQVTSNPFYQKQCGSN
jgi:hypothetical protein